MAVDADTKKYLEEVKKGKPRKFVMICKGVKILSMIVYKKGTVEKYKKQAKEEGKGQFYHGVVTGKGQAISFNLLRSDGFEKPPGKELILKDFLKTQADMKFKPTYEIVDCLPELDESDDASATKGALDTATAEATEEAATPTPPPPPDAATADPAARAQKLAEALKKLKPLLDQVINADPNRKGELHATMVQIAGEIKGKEFDQAKQNIVDFATLLKSLTAQQPASSASESADRSIQFTARRDALEPRLLEFQKADREKATKLGAVWSYADEQVQANNFANAFKALDRLETALDGVLGAPAKADAEQAEDAQHEEEAAPDPLDAKWLASFAKVEPLALDALKTNPFEDEAGLAEFRKAWDWAVNCAADGAYDKALAALLNALKLLKQAPASGTSAPVVDINPEVKPFAEARLSWRKARGTMGSELKKLQDAIVSVCDGDDELQIVVDNVANLTRHLVRLDERLEDKLDEIVNAGAGQTREERKIEARKLLGEYEKELDNEFFGVVDSGNGFANVAVASTAKAALAEISRVLS